MLSIIIPVYNEEKKLGDLITHLEENISNRKVEIIFVDGGSTDKTQEICQKSIGELYLSPRKGRAAQMNYGASKAKGDIFYFLHADTFPPVNFIDDIYRNIGKGFQSGCFRLRFDSDHFLLKFYTWFTKFDVDLFRFGDQSLYVLKDIFKKVGGFDESLTVMEDQQIVIEIKKSVSFTVMCSSVETSSRKYRKVGILKLQFIFVLIVIAYYLGVRQETMVDFYFRQLN